MVFGKDLLVWMYYNRHCNKKNKVVENGYHWDGKRKSVSLFQAMEHIINTLLTQFTNKPNHKTQDREVVKNSKHQDSILAGEAFYCASRGRRDGSRIFYVLWAPGTLWLSNAVPDIGFTGFTSTYQIPETLIRNFD